MKNVLEEDGGIRTVQEWLDYGDLSMTMIDAYVLNLGGRGVSGPAD